MDLVQDLNGVWKLGEEEVLNAGIGPDWEAVEIELVRRAKRERWRADFLAKFEESVAAQKGGTPQ